MVNALSGPLRLPLLTLMLVGALLLTGCHGNDRVGERVDLRMLTYDQLGEYANKGTPSHKFLVHLGSSAPTDFENRRLDIYKAPSSGERSPLAAAVVPILIGAAIDYASGQLNDRAESFEAQWGTARINDGFYAKNKESKWETRFVGVELVRSTKRYPAEEGGASRLVLLFLPSKSDKRLFVVYPLFYGNRSPKASVGQGASISVDIALTMDATWVGADHRAAQARVAYANFEITGYSITVPNPRFWGKPESDSAGWFAAGPIAPQNDASVTGAYRIGISVTERDEGETRQWIERGAKYLTDNKSSLVESVSGSSPN